MLPAKGSRSRVTCHSSGVSLMRHVTVLPHAQTETGARDPEGSRTPVNRNACRVGYLPDCALLPRLALDGRLDQAREERVRAGRAGAQLRVRLGGDQVGVDLARVLDVLDELVVRGGAGEERGRPSSPARRGRRCSPRSGGGGAPRRTPCRRTTSRTIEPSASLAGYMPSRMVPPMSPSPSTMSSCSAMVEMTGWAVAASNSVELASGMLGEVARGLDHDALQAQAEAEQRDLVLAGVLDRADLAVDTAVAEAAGDADRVDVGELPARRRPGSCSRRR